MDLRFTIIDYTTDTAGIDTIIEEPVGWDGIALRMKRDKMWHGFFDFVDDSVDSLEFIDDGFSVLKTAYEGYGATAKVHLLVEYQCAEGDTFDTLYLGRFVFSKFKWQCGDLCIASCGVEALDCLMVFRNRYDQQVDLDSLAPFDDTCVETLTLPVQFNAPDELICTQQLDRLLPGDTFVVSGTVSNNGTFTVVSNSWNGTFMITTLIVVEAVVTETAVTTTLTGCIKTLALVPYTGLNYPVEMPSKTVRLESKWLTTIQTDYTYTIPNPNPFAYRVAITPDWANVISEIENTLVGTGLFVDALPLGGGSGTTPDYGGFTAENEPDYLIFFTGNVDSSSLTCIGAAALHLSFIYGLGSSTVHPSIDAFKLYVVKDQNFTPPYTGQTAGPQQWVFDLIIDFNTPHVFNQTINFNLNVGESIWIWFDISAQAGIGGENFILQLSADSFFDLQIDSDCSPTVANLYKINEVMARCVEAYTDDCMTVYSDYFGRTDAQPYPSASDGCGGQLGIANGKKIRNAPNTDGTTPIRMTVSMKDTFEALNATDNIGMGLEVDPNRAGHNLIRVEPINYFFNETVLMTCDHIREVKRDVDAQLIFSIYKGGYDKWETWNANGLYDLFGDREYRTELSELSNTLNQICRWIASDYAIEFTRRLYGTTTSDWKYDDDIFFLCFKPCWTGTIAFTASTKIINIPLVGNHTPPIDTVYVGDTITVSGTLSNDGTYTIASIIQNDADSLIFVVNETLVNEIMFDDATICNLTHPFTIIEQGVDNPANILFPDTVLNYRIAPSRNAMRWFKTMLQSYRTFPGKKLIFTQGGGNILGEGEVLNTDGCRLEDAVVRENQDIVLDDFIYQELNIPKFYPELVKFTYPMSYAEYLVVKANPYGLIEFQCGSAPMEAGWIEDMKYSPYEGTVDFVLRPRIPVACEESILSELGNGLLTEDDQCILTET